MCCASVGYKASGEMLPTLCLSQTNNQGVLRDLEATSIACRHPWGREGGCAQIGLVAVCGSGEGSEQTAATACRAPAVVPCLMCRPHTG